MKFGRFHLPIAILLLAIMVLSNVPGMATALDNVGEGK
jgi:hypothetical protein